MNTTILSQIMVSICENGMSLADDIIMLRYIAKELANTMGLKAVFDNILMMKNKILNVYLIFIHQV